MCNVKLNLVEAQSNEEVFIVLSSLSLFFTSSMKHAVCDYIGIMVYLKGSDELRLKEEWYNSSNFICSNNHT